MRIALVVTGGFDPSGRERVTPALLWLVERLSSRHQVVVYVLRYYDRPTTYPLLGATIRDLGSPRGAAAQYSALVTAMRKDGPFDVVHGYQALPGGLMAVLAGKRLGVPSVATFDSGEFAALPDIGYGLQLRMRHRAAVAFTARMARRTTVCSLYQEQLAKRHGYQPLVIPIGVDVTRFTPAAATPAEDPIRILHVASLNPVKDQTTLLEALARPGLTGVRLDVVGEDTLHDAVGASARKLGLESRVTFHGWQIGDALAGFCQRAHLFAMSSRHEAASVAVLEAAACGLASVGTRVGYLADWDGERAIAVPPRDPEALASAILDLIADPARRARLASTARSWTLAHDADWTVGRFEELYTSLRS
jgi:glycosyltransferase involved in cell wall biosynthesis